MRKLLVCISLIFLWISYSFAIAENALTLPNELIECIINEEDYQIIYNQFIQHSENPDNADTFIRELPNNSFMFIIDNIIIDGVSYRSIFGTTTPTDHFIELEYECPFGEAIEDSKVFINTINAYESKYSRVELDAESKEKNRESNIASIRWIDKESKTEIEVQFKKGDIQKGELPLIRVVFK